MNKKTSYDTLDFAAFEDDLELELTDVFAERMPGTVIRRKVVEKLQTGKYYAFSVIPPKVPVAIQLNVGEIYEKSLEEAAGAGTKRNMRKIAEESADIVIHRICTIPDEVLNLGEEYEDIRPHLILELVRIEGNEKMLESVPHESIEDLALVYRFMIGSESALIDYDFLDAYEISEEQLRSDAMENAQKTNPVRIRNLRDIIEELSGGQVPTELPEDGDSHLYFVGNKNNCLGASAYFYPGVMEHCAELLGGSYYVLPSSIHEVLLLKDDGNVDEHQLESMIADINASVVIPSERLTDHPYYYDAIRHSFRSV